jgi:guanylate kinase
MELEKETEDFDQDILAYLSTRKQKLIESHGDYISHHPEMREILNDFLASALLNKPDDVYLFAKEYFHPFNPTPVKDKPFIVCGPFGVGKKSLRKKVLTKYGDLFDYCISHTSRKVKPGENEDTLHYVTREQFEKMQKEGKFLETAESWGDYYGTSKAEIERIRNEGKIPYIEVDFRGANGLKSIAANFVFLYPPSIEELRRRIANRNEDTEELFKKRMELAIKEIELANNAVLFTNRITNDDMEKAEQQLCTLIEALYFQELKDKRGDDYEPQSATLPKPEVKKAGFTADPKADHKADSKAAPKTDSKPDETHELEEPGSEINIGSIIAC